MQAWLISPLKENTKVVTNTGFKSSEVKELLNMKRQKVMALFQASNNLSTHTVVTGSFGQDGGTRAKSKWKVAFYFRVIC